MSAMAIKHPAIIGWPEDPSDARGMALWTSDELPADPQQWRATAIEHQESWWEDWTRWIAERAGTRVAPPTMGNVAYPPLGDAPGTYVTS